MFRTRTPRIALAPLLLFLIGSCAAAPCRADTVATEAARQLARKVAAQLADTKPSFYLVMQDLTGQLSTAELNDVQQVCAAELRANSLRQSAEASANVAIRFTLSEDMNERLWVADFTRDGKTAVAFAAFKRSEGSSAPAFAARTIRIQPQLLYEQVDPILDFVVTSKFTDGTATGIAVLGTDSVSFHNWSDGQWHLGKVLPISHEASSTRDPRGHLSIDQKQGKLWAGVPGTFCESDALAIAPPTCKSSERWVFMIALELIVVQEPVAGRNFFHDTDPRFNPNLQFYSSADVVADAGKQGKLVAGLDGRLSFLRGRDAPVAVSGPFGSDLLEATSPCTGQAVLLFTGHGDYTMTDQLQAFELIGKQTVAAGVAADLPGPITALLGDFRFEPVHAVVRNLRTGHYEAYQISLSCNY